MTNFSILMRVHKRPKSLRTALQSILVQDYPNIKVFATLDSKDDFESEQVLEEFIDKGLKIFITRVNPLGYPACNLYLNTLISLVDENSWIHILDDDDMYMQSTLFSELNSIINTYTPSAIITKVKVDLNGVIIESPIPFFWKKKPQLQNFGSSNMIFPRSVVKTPKFTETLQGDFDGLISIYDEIDSNKIFWFDKSIIAVKASLGKSENA